MCVCVSHTFSLTRIAEHCRGTPIILCGFHVTEFALQSLIYVLMYWGCFTKDFFKLTQYSHVLTSPLHWAYGDASWTSEVHHPMLPEETPLLLKGMQARTEYYYCLSSRYYSDYSNVYYSHQHGATSCTSHRCQRSHWLGQMHRTLSNQQWHLQTMAHNPVQTAHMTVRGEKVC